MGVGGWGADHTPLPPPFSMGVSNYYLLNMKLHRVYLLVTGSTSQ